MKSSAAPCGPPHWPVVLLLPVIVVTYVLVIQWTAAAPMPTETSDGGAKRHGRFFMEFARIIQEIMNYKKSGFSVSCNTCVFGLEMLKGMIDENKTADDIVDVATSLCVSLGVAKESVCRPMLVEIVDEVIYVYKHTNHTIPNMCGFILGGTCIRGSFLEEFDWNVTLTPEPPYDPPPPPPHPHAPKLRILQISDVHVDEQYAEGSVANCDEPLCCHPWSTTAEANVTAAGKWGGTGVCDVPTITLENLLEYVTENVQFDVVYWTGDIPAHDVWNQTKEGNLQGLRDTVSIFKKFFGDTPVYPCLGNHESEPVNSVPVPAAYSDYNVSYLYEALAVAWQDLVPGFEGSVTVKRGAFYSTLVRPGLRLISLNMNYCNSLNWWLLVDSEDPTAEMEWLVEQLDAAEANNEKVHLIGHIPPGTTDCAYVWSRNLRRIVLRYKNTIVGQFYGHTHKDEFEIVYDDSEPPQAISVNHIGPSVTSFDGVNPAFRLYTVDGPYDNCSFALLDYVTYYMDLAEANEVGIPEWNVLYSALDTYDLESLLPSEWHSLLTRMTSNDTLFQIYRRNYYRGVDHGGCDDICKKNLLCSIRKGWSGAEC